MGVIDPRRPVSDEERISREFEALKDRVSKLERPTGSQIARNSERVAQASGELAGRTLYAASATASHTEGGLTGDVGLSWGPALAQLVIEIPPASSGVLQLTVSGAINLSEQGYGMMSGYLGVAVDGVPPAGTVQALGHQLQSAAGNTSRTSINASRTIRRTFEPGRVVTLSVVPGWRHQGSSTGSLLALDAELLAQVVS